MRKKEIKTKKSVSEIFSWNLRLWWKLFCIKVFNFLIIFKFCAEHLALGGNFTKNHKNSYSNHKHHPHFIISFISNLIFLLTITYNPNEILPLVLFFGLYITIYKKTIGNKKLWTLLGIWRLKTDCLLQKIHYI